MKYKAIVFDIDGTLLDTAKMNILPLIEVLKVEQGKTYTYDELAYLVAFSGTLILKKVGIPDEDNERVLAEWIQMIQTSGIPSTPFDGVLELLETLHKKGIVMGIVSSKEKKQYQFDIVNKHIDYYFKPVILADDTENHKPHPDPLLKCLKQLNVQPQEVLYIGDSDADGLCASACGCDFAYASWGPLELSVPYTYKLKEPRDILTIVGEE